MHRAAGESTALQRRVNPGSDRLSQLRSILADLCDHLGLGPTESPGDEPGSA